MVNLQVGRKVATVRYAGTVGILEPTYRGIGGPEGSVYGSLNRGSDDLGFSVSVEQPRRVSKSYGTHLARATGLMPAAPHLMCFDAPIASFR